MPDALTDVPGWADAGYRALTAADPVLADALRDGGQPPWRVRPEGFPGLLRAICGQVISDRAADLIWERLSRLPGALTPEGLLRLDDAALCGIAGLSRPKAGHARSVARAVASGSLALEGLPALDDDEAAARLRAVPGLGPWSAAVYLLFSEGRPDVFPAGDLALAASWAMLRGLPSRPTPRELAATALRWHPHRSLAARLLWHRRHLARGLSHGLARGVVDHAGRA